MIPLTDPHGSIGYGQPGQGHGWILKAQDLITRKGPNLSALTSLRYRGRLTDARLGLGRDDLVHEGSGLGRFLWEKRWILVQRKEKNKFQLIFWMFLTTTYPCSWLLQVIGVDASPIKEILKKIDVKIRNDTVLDP